MISKKVIYLITLLFIVSGIMLIPVLIPYMSPEKQPASESTLDPFASPEDIIDYSTALKEQADRNISKLETAQIFNKWFVVSFTVFITTSLALSALLIWSLFNKNLISLKQTSSKTKEN